MKWNVFDTHFMQVIYLPTRFFKKIPARGANSLLDDYGYIALFLLVSIGFAVLMVTMPVILRKLGIIPHRPNLIKNATFECGLVTVGRSWVQFNPRYYFFALMMMALDVMAIFIFSWALILKQAGAFALWAALVLIAIIGLGYLFAWRKKVLEWK